MLTPGKWAANAQHQARANDSEIVIEQEGGSSPICVVKPINTHYTGGNQSIANAKAIASVPQMIFALHKILDFCNQPGQPDIERAGIFAEMALTHAGQMDVSFGDVSLDEIAEFFSK